MQQSAGVNGSSAQPDNRATSVNSDNVLVVVTPGAEKLQPPSLSSTSSSESTLVPSPLSGGQTLPKKSNNPAEPGEFCITLPPHIKTKDKQRFFYGDAAYYFHVSPEEKERTSFGLTLEVIEKMMQALSAQYSGVLTATGSDEDDFTRMIDKISQEVSVKCQAIVTMSQKSTMHEYKDIIDIYIGDKLPNQQNSYELTSKLKTFWADIKTFGNLPQMMSFMMLAKDEKVARALENKSFYITHDVIKFKNSFDLYG